MKIKNVVIKAGVPESVYFEDEGRIGSTQYGQYCQSPGALAVEMLKTDDEEAGRALIFGKLLHGLLDGTYVLEDFTVGKNKTTNASMLEKKEIGSADMFILKLMLSNFPIDLERLKVESEVCEQEVGYFLDFELESGEVIKVRCKADLLFRMPFSNEIEIVDFKTASAFQNGKFDERYQNQAELYAFCAYFIHGAMKFIPTTYYFMKEAPYQQYDVVRPTIEITEEVIDRVISNLIGTEDVIKDPIPYLKHNVILSNESLKCFAKSL